MKTILPRLVAVVALGAAGLFWSKDNSKTTAIAKLEEQVKEVEALHSEVAELKKSAVAPAEIERLQKDSQELLRLRNEVRQLRDDKKQLAQQAQTAQTVAQRAQEQAVAESQRAAQQAEALAQAQSRVVVTQVAAQTQDVCINNLRQLDGAKQQWALESGKTAEAVPVEKDITPYLKDSAMVKCPAGGVYTLNAVSAIPTCTIPTHKLPQ